MNGNVCITVYIIIEDIARVLLITFEGSFIEEKKKINIRKLSKLSRCNLT